MGTGGDNVPFKCFNASFSSDADTVTDDPWVALVEALLRVKGGVSAIEERIGKGTGKVCLPELYGDGEGGIAQPVSSITAGFSVLTVTGLLGGLQVGPCSPNGQLCTAVGAECIVTAFASPVPGGCLFPPGVSEESAECPDCEVLGGNCAFDKRVVEFDGQERVFCESRGTAEEGFCDKLLTPCDPSDIGTNGNCCGVDTLPDGSPGGRLVCQRASDALRLLYDYCNLAGGPLDVIPPPVAKLSLDLADKISGPTDADCEVCTEPPTAMGTGGDNVPFKCFNASFSSDADTVTDDPWVALVEALLRVKGGVSAIEERIGKGTGKVCLPELYGDGEGRIASPVSSLAAGFTALSVTPALLGLEIGPCVPNGKVCTDFGAECFTSEFFSPVPAGCLFPPGTTKESAECPDCASLGGNCAFSKTVVEIDGRKRVLCQSQGFVDKDFCLELFSPCDEEDIGTNGECCGVDALPDGSISGKLICQRAGYVVRDLLEWCNLAATGGPADLISAPLAEIAVAFADKISPPLCAPPDGFQATNWFPGGSSVLGGLLGEDVIKACGDMLKPLDINLKNLGS
ncbi:unnamed protein product [Vitrella brassicaformis CCMP3155]|uniref:Uncharacterized protein n=2 Tax=Vitrella brassicaformis TaxID=1169539 RepID=A0A0G4FD73_VITBC|nr:unnamed protein product [Vitrella brassicaformis CCMP3155]|eukprot:CEM11112.1 unnamed protein product [Vitrella brassicaformis CCMP3155]